MSKVVPIKKDAVEYSWLTCDCMAGEHGWSQFRVVFGTDASVSYECVNCGSGHTVSPEEFLKEAGG